MGVNIKVTSGPVLARPGDLAAMLTTELSEGDILFIDEIHRLNPAVEEALYPAMEDFTFFINTGKGAGSTTLKLAVPRFTLVGATTRSGLLTGPLRDRFGIVFNLGFYEVPEITDILERSARLLHIDADREGLTELAKRSRGTPRIANRLLRRARDFAQVKGKGVITREIAQTAMDSLDIDSEGLDSMDKRILEALIDRFSGGPVGVENLAIAVSESVDTLTDVIEPFLIKAGFIARTPRGRVAARKAYEHLGRKQHAAPPCHAQRLLQRAVPAADNGGDAVFIESAVAHRAVGNAAAEQLLLARQTEMAVLRARGEDHGAAFVYAVLRADGEILSGALHGDHFADVGFGVEREHLLEHPLGELRPADGGDAGVVFHARRIGDLAAVALAFEKKNGFPASAGINGGGHSRRAAPGNDDVVHVSLTFRGENPSVAALCAATAPLLGEPS